MTTINARIKNVRKEAGMNQKEFSESIGVTQSGVSYMEQDGRNVSDMTIKSICNYFNVNEDWLRNGTEPMYIPESTFSLDKFVKDHGGTELELDIMKTYFELEPDIRAMLVQHFKERLTASRTEPSEMTVEDAEAAYIKSRSQNVQNTALSASNITNDTNNHNQASKTKASNQ